MTLDGDRAPIPLRSTAFTYTGAPAGNQAVFALLAFPRRSVTVYGVDLRVRELVPDLDQLRNQRAWAERCVRPTLGYRWP